jgi:hypothetical protein
LELVNVALFGGFEFALVHARHPLSLLLCQRWASGILFFYRRSDQLANLALRDRDVLAQLASNARTQIRPLYFLAPANKAFAISLGALIHPIREITRLLVRIMVVSSYAERNPFCMEVTMYRAVIVALASVLLILPATELLARGGGGGHGGGGGGGGPGGGSGGSGHSGGGGGPGGGVGGGGGGGRAGFAGAPMGGFGGGRAGYTGGHMGRMHAGPPGPVGFRAGANFNRANVNRANVNRHVVANRFRHRKVFFNGGYGGDYYYSCYPIWNGYRWVNSCNWGNYGY